MINRINVKLFVSDIDWRNDAISRFTRVVIFRAQSSTFAPVIIFSCEAQLNTCTYVLSVRPSVCPSQRGNSHCYDNLWQFMTTYDNLWQNMTTYDNLWQLMTTYDNLWQLLTVFDSLLNLLTSFDIFWQLMSAYDSFWQLLTAFDSLWQITTAFDSFWQLMTACLW